MNNFGHKTVLDPTTLAALTGPPVTYEEALQQTSCHNAMREAFRSILMDIIWGPVVSKEKPTVAENCERSYPTDDSIEPS